MKGKITIISLLVLAAALLVVAFSLMASALGFGSCSQASGCGGVEGECNFTVKDTRGRDTELSDFYGKPVVINLWASWCNYCLVEMPIFEEKYASEKGVEFMMINTQDTRSEAEAVLLSNDYSFPVYYDDYSQAADMFNSASGIPITVFINRDGTVEHIARGMVDEATLTKYINKIKLS